LKQRFSQVEAYQASDHLDDDAAPWRDESGSRRDRSKAL
jgi:hypothetical protein